MELSTTIPASNPEPVIEEVKQAPATNLGFDFGGNDDPRPSAGANLGLADGDDPFAPNIGQPVDANNFDTYTDPFGGMDDKYLASGFPSTLTSEAGAQPPQTANVQAS